MSNEAVSLDGFTCERKDRLTHRGGGVACYVKQCLCYDRLPDIESDDLEVLWLKIKPKHLPRSISCIILACVCHPPRDDNRVMSEYLMQCLDVVIRRHPDCGLLLTGDFNQLRDWFLRAHYGLVQVVDKATRGNAVLDRLWTNMNPVYSKAVVSPELSNCDHKMVLLTPSNSDQLGQGSVQQLLVKVTTSVPHSRQPSQTSDRSRFTNCLPAKTSVDISMIP